ncbi:MAG: rhodanese-like domain-containing protein [Acidobacteriota bacterium]
MTYRSALPVSNGFAPAGLLHWLVMPDIPIEISPAEVRARIDAGEALRLIDVREIPEHRICRIEGARLLPMNSIPQHLQELDTDGPALVVFCHHGVRSLAVVDWLRRHGVANCQSMAGGIDLWSSQIDPSVPRY